MDLCIIAAKSGTGLPHSKTWRCVGEQREQLRLVGDDTAALRGICTLHRQALTFQGQDLMMRFVLGRFSKWLVILTLTFFLGAHWLLLQSVAWTGMIITYSETGSFTEAISKTFDGQHPCPLCKLVQQGKGAEKKQASQKAENKTDEFLPVYPELALTSPTLAFTFPSVQDHPASRAEAPPTPPPRNLSV